MKRPWLVTASLLFVVLFFSSCDNINKSSKSNADAMTNKSEAEQIKFRTVTMLITQGRYYDTYKKIQNKLKVEENISLDIQVIPDDQYYNLVKTKLAARVVPDIMTANAPTQYDEVDVQKTMVDLTGEPWVSRLSNPDLIKASDGKIYAKPVESRFFLQPLTITKRYLRIWA